MILIEAIGVAVVLTILAIGVGKVVNWFTSKMEK